MPTADLHFRRANRADLPRLEAIRQGAFAPVFASFRALLGDEIYARAQRREDEGQRQVLVSLLVPDSPWEVHVATVARRVVGFVAIRFDHETLAGEIGLNAVDPSDAGHGIGTAMYDFAVRYMREAGMKVATVATGGDPSHAPARRAYRKAGFDVEIPSVWMCRRL